MIFEMVTKELASSSEVQNSEFLRSLCASIIAMYPNGEPVIPWAGYLAKEADVFVGTCAYKSSPVQGGVEIAYFTFPEHEGRKIASSMAQHLVNLAAENGASIIKAQTLPEASASTRILEKLGFRLVGSVDHPEDGHVWEWHFLAKSK